jgi:hypothetical protein
MSRKYSRRQNIHHLFSRASQELQHDHYFKRLAEAANHGTKAVFGDSVPDPREAELQVAEALSDANTGGVLVFAYGSPGGKTPMGFMGIKGISGLLLPENRSCELWKLSISGFRKIKKLIEHHKPDVLIYNNRSNQLLEVEVKHTCKSTFTSFPKACRTDYDYYALISENDTFFIYGDDYRTIAKARYPHENGTIDLDFTPRKKMGITEHELYNSVKNSINSVGTAQLASTLVNAVMHRLMPQGKQNQMTLPFRIDGHKVRLDLKLEGKESTKISQSNLRKLIKESLNDNER